MAEMVLKFNGTSKYKKSKKKKSNIHNNTSTTLRIKKNYNVYYLCIHTHSPTQHCFAKKKKMKISHELPPTLSAIIIPFHRNKFDRLKI